MPSDLKPKLNTRSDEAWKFVNPATGCAKCPALVQSRQNIVYSKGPADAEIMIIAEAPGAQEDIKQQPFVGRSGKLLNEMLMTTGVHPSRFHYANVIMCRPPDNRDPYEEEIANCSPWLVEHIRTVNPKAIIHFGRYSIQTVFNKLSVADTRGLMYRTTCDACGNLSTEHAGTFAESGEFKKDWLGFCKRGDYSRRRLHLSTYHPAAALRNPANKDIILHDLARFRDEYGQLLLEEQNA